jgi:hypothetical protein
MSNLRPPRQAPNVQFVRLAKTDCANGQSAGSGDGKALLSQRAFDESAVDASLKDNLAAIERSLDDLKAGRVQDARTAMREIAAKYGFRIDR